MTAHPKRRITRRETYALVAAVTAVALACVVLTWGFLALILNRAPVVTPGVVSAAAPLLVFSCGVVLAVVLWRLALTLLRGDARLPLAQILLSAGGSYLLWCLVGSVFGMGLSDTWLSPFAAALAGIWGCAALLSWVLFLHRLYGDAVVMRWPWERLPAGENSDERSDRE